tara:strand:+ start:3692 stop:4324 length:633 start_codon:yes stop_codon:yes gene_type:complete
MARKGFVSASKFRVTVNAKELLKELTVDNDRAMGTVIRSYIAPKLQKKQDRLVKNFKTDKITIELKAGPTASNSSGILGGYGNLFSFIGFSAGENPTGVIEKIFEQKFRFKVRRINKTGKYKITFFIPSTEEIYGLTPIPWASGSSWVDGIEKGMSNVGSFLYSSRGFGQSNSGTGIQAKNKSSGVTFRNTPYTTRLLNNFKRTLVNFTK